MEHLLGTEVTSYHPYFFLSQCIISETAKSTSM